MCIIIGGNKRAPEGALYSTIKERNLESERVDLNHRPLDPQSSALPGYATSRKITF